MFKALFTTTSRRVIAPLLLATASLAFGPAYAEGDAAAGATKAGSCAGCHGADGKSTSPENPNLAAQHAGYPNAIMAGMAASLSPEDIADIAAHYSGQSPVAGVANEEGLQLGEDIYRGGITDVGIPACSGCHGASGNGNPAAGFPALAGQNATYTIAQLKMFRSKERANDANAMMRGVAQRLTDAEIEAVSNYIMGLH